MVKTNIELARMILGFVAPDPIECVSCGKPTTERSGYATGGGVPMMSCYCPHCEDSFRVEGACIDEDDLLEAGREVLAAVDDPDVERVYHYPAIKQALGVDDIVRIYKCPGCGCFQVDCPPQFKPTSDCSCNDSHWRYHHKAHFSQETNIPLNQIEEVDEGRKDELDLGELTNSKVIEAIDQAQGIVEGVLERNAGLPGGDPAYSPGVLADAVSSMYEDYVEKQTAKYQDEIGSMGVALGMVEGQRDDLIACAESTLEFLKWLAYGNNCKLDEDGLSFLEVTHKGINKSLGNCKAGVTKPPTQATYQQVDYCTIKLYFTEPEDLQKFVANYQPKVKS